MTRSTGMIVTGVGAIAMVIATVADVLMKNYYLAGASVILLLLNILFFFVWLKKVI